MRNVFSHSDASLILKIPLCQRRTRDRLIWIRDSLGQFLVRSAYIVAKEMLGREELPNELRSPIWKLIWSGWVLPKVKHFMWCLLWAMLPTTNNMNVRGMHLATRCCVCGEEAESIFHLFFGCKFSKEVWNKTCGWVFSSVETGMEMGDFWERLTIKAKQADDLEVFYYTLWMIWQNRNTSFHEFACKTPLVLANKAKIMVEEFRSTNEQNIGQLAALSSTLPLKTWQVPPVGYVKLNTDASFNHSNGAVGLGLVTRHDLGNILISALFKVDRANTVLHVKVLAILQGLRVVKEKNYRKVIVESNSLIALNLLKTGDEVMWEGESVVLDALDIAGSCDICLFKHIKREANSKAHKMS